MMQQILQDVIQKIEKNYLIKDLGNIVELYQSLPDNKVSLYLTSLKNITEILPHLENVQLGKDEIEKGTLMFLAALDLCAQEENKENKNELKSIANLLSHVYSLNQNDVREKILFGYLAVGLNLFRDFPHQAEVLSEKIILCELHDTGAFQPGIWGISVDLNLLAQVLKNIHDYSDEKITKLSKKYSPLRLEELSLLARFT